MCMYTGGGQEKRNSNTHTCMHAQIIIRTVTLVPTSLASPFAKGLVRQTRYLYTVFDHTRRKSGHEVHAPDTLRSGCDSRLAVWYRNLMAS